LGRCRMARATICTRSSKVNSGCLLSLLATATMTRSNNWSLRWRTSRWPLVMGSKLPGYIAVRIERTLTKAQPMRAGSSVYVARVAFGANDMQTIKAFLESRGPTMGRPFWSATATASRTVTTSSTAWNSRRPPSSAATGRWSATIPTSSSRARNRCNWIQGALAPGSSTSTFQRKALARLLRQSSPRSPNTSWACRGEVAALRFYRFMGAQPGHASPESPAASPAASPQPAPRPPQPAPRQP